MAANQAHRDDNLLEDIQSRPVSHTHLTLPPNREVPLPVDAASTPTPTHRNHHLPTPTTHPPPYSIWITHTLYQST